MKKQNLNPSIILECVYESVRYFEIFRDIPDYDGIYQISTFGRIKSLKFEKEKILSLNITSNGYLTVVLYKNGQSVTKNIHQLSAITFLGHKPNSHKIVVDHKDNNPLNNFYKNFKLITGRENTSKDRKGCSSKYVGVEWNKRRNKWRSTISINGNRIELCSTDCELKAANTYKKALKNINLYNGNNKEFRNLIKHEKPV